MPENIEESELLGSLGERILFEYSLIYDSKVVMTADNRFAA